MKRRVNLLAGVILLAASGTALAQEVIIAPEQQVIIREYVIANPVEPIPMIDGVAVGQLVPPEVVLYPIDSSAFSYSYVVMDGQTLIVEPETRQIVQILE